MFTIPKVMGKKRALLFFFFRLQIFFWGEEGWEQARTLFCHIQSCKAETGFSGLATWSFLGTTKAGCTLSPQQFPPEPLGTESPSSVPAGIPLQNTAGVFCWGFFGRVFALVLWSYRAETLRHIVPYPHSSRPLFFHKRIQRTPQYGQRKLIFSGRDSRACSSPRGYQHSCPSSLEPPCRCSAQCGRLVRARLCSLQGVRSQIPQVLSLGNRSSPRTS